MHASVTSMTNTGAAIRLGLMALLFAALIVAASAFSANAQTGRNAPDASKLNCSAIQKRLQRYGLLYLYTRHRKVERFVRDTRHCTVSRSVRYTTVRTKDKRYCTVTQCSGDDLLDDHSRGHRGGHHGHGRGRY